MMRHEVTHHVDDLLVRATAAMAMSATFARSAVPAHAAGKFANRTAMHKVYPHGVAKSKAAAEALAEQVADARGARLNKRLYYRA